MSVTIKILNSICIGLIIFFSVTIIFIWHSFFSVEEILSLYTATLQINENFENKYVESGIVLPDDVISEDEDFSEDIAVTSTAKEATQAITQKELPKEINLDIPFTSQAPELNWNQPWQDACEEATVLMVDAYYKNYGLSPIFSRDEMQKMIDWQTERGWAYSIPIVKVGELVSEFISRPHKILESPTIDQIKHAVADGHPVIVVAYGKDLPNPYFSGDGPDYHALVIRGYTEDGFITNDPGTRRGENFVYKYADLMNAIHDWNSGDPEHGDKVVLVVE